MMTAVAAGGYTAGLFHLFTHAFFKALLFLGAGSVIHAVHSNNMSDMGGLRKEMPTTYWTFVVGSLALAGILPFAGFWSKDEILATLDYGGYGTYKGTAHPHESPKMMTRPLIGLAIPSILFGLFNIPGVKWPGIGNFTEWLGVRVVAMGDHHADEIDFGLAAIGLAAAVAGIVLGWLIFSPDRATQKERDSLEIPGLYPVLRRKLYVDDVALGLVGATKGPAARFVDWTNTYILDGIVNGVGAIVKSLGGFVYNVLDQLGVDGIFNGLSAATDGAGAVVRRWQTGRVQQYLAAFVGGALVLAVVFIFVIT